MLCVLLTIFKLLEASILSRISRAESQSGLSNKTMFFEIIDVDVFLVDQTQWSVRIVPGWYVV